MTSEILEESRFQMIVAEKNLEKSWKKLKLKYDQNWNCYWYRIFFFKTFDQTPRCKSFTNINIKKIGDLPTQKVRKRSWEKCNN